MPGLIVSIQGFSAQLTQELVDLSLKSGACGVRTDRPVICEGLLIGLRKNAKEYYITTDEEDLKEVCSWSPTVAIDSRAGNKDLKALFSQADALERNICADIQTEEDLDNMRRLGLNPKYISTTFSFLKTGYPDFSLFKIIKLYFPKSKIIAEGGMFEYLELIHGQPIDYVCIGAGITDISQKINKIAKELRK